MATSGLTRVLCVAVLGAAAWISPGSLAMAADPPKPPTVTTEPYRPMVQHNIFSMQSPRMRGTGPVVNIQPRQQRIQSPVLRGIAKSDDGYVAFLEDVGSGRVTQARVGQTLPQGKITDMTLEYLMIQPADAAEARRVDVSRNLAPDTFITLQEAVPAPGPDGGPATAPAAVPSGLPGAAPGAMPAALPGGIAPAGGDGYPPGFVPKGDGLDEMRLKRLKEGGGTP